MDGMGIFMSDDKLEQKSFILVKFENFGSSLCDIMFQNVTAGQLFASADMLKIRAEMAFMQQERDRIEREREQQLSVPKPEILIPK